jgi:hypothetical protein
MSGRLTDKAIADYIAVVHPYTLISVLDAQQGMTGIHFSETEVLDSEVTIEDSHGVTYGPLPPDSVAEDIRNLIQMMRPLLSNSMGAMGQHMEILVFPSTDKAGHPIADPRGDGFLTVHIRNIALRYRLPLGSVLPPSLDPRTGDSFPGSYRFNPYTGTKLVIRAPDTYAGSAPKPQ